MNIFEKANKLKVRFATALGSVTVEDLWDMPLTSRKANASLDDLAKSLSKSVKESAEESFVVKKSSKNTELELKFDIVKHIIDIKLAEREAAANAAERKAQKEKVLRVIEAKKDADLENQSLEDLQKMAAEL